ncbi:unnamed protein product, partial [Didymodactylos carnosus]
DSVEQLWDQIRDDIVSWTVDSPVLTQIQTPSLPVASGRKIVPIKRLFKLGTDELEQSRLFIEALKTKLNNNNGVTITDPELDNHVIILLNGGLSKVSSRLMNSIPYLMFDLNKQREPNDDDIVKILYYLKNLNVLSKSYTERFESIEGLMQKSEVEFTTAGKGIAVAFYFNYAKLLTSTKDHRERVQTLKSQLYSEKLIDDIDKIFIEKWVFILPWTTNGSLQLLKNACLFKESGFDLSQISLKLININLTLAGVVERSYSPLFIFQLTKIDENKTYYFPMEIPAAFHGLQNQYENSQAEFHFGKFHPVDQAGIFQKEVQHYYNEEKNTEWHEHIMLVPIPKPNHNMEKDNYTSKVLLDTLWSKLSTIASNN